MEHSIPQTPVLLSSILLCLVVLAVLILPFKVKKVEENLEPFFLVMGLLAVTISHFTIPVTMWTWSLVVEALEAPVIIGGIPIGIFQVVLIFGLLTYYFNKQFVSGVVSIANKLGPRLFIFLLVLIFGLISSVISVIITAVLLAEMTAVLPYSKKDKIKLVVVTCFAVGMGAVLTPLGEPLSTILVQKLSGAPYNAGFAWCFNVFGIWVIPGVVALAIFGAFYIGNKISIQQEKTAAVAVEGVKTVIMRAVKVFVFVAALVLLGKGLEPLVTWFLLQVHYLALFWINIISAFLDNATLTAIEIGPKLLLPQITAIILGLLIAGGMLVPGNIPNIVAAGRLKITMKEWAVIGVPMGLVLMVIYFVILLLVAK
jgi:predicted cation transporter